MKSIFRPSLVNDRFGDPSVYVDTPWERRGLLFDLGMNYHLAPRRLLKVSDVFVSHAHMDHFIGFDHLIRIRLPHHRRLRLFGPTGITDKVASKLSGYSWNLVADYPFSLQVIEIDAECVLRTEMTASERFVPHHAESMEETAEVKTVFQDRLMSVRATILDHKIPSVAYAVSESHHVNINRDALDRAGMPRGEWLRELKERIRAGDDEEGEIEVPGQGRFNLGQLRAAVVSVTRGQKIAYVVDAAFHPQNVQRIIAVSDEADVLFCEAPFLDRDAARAYQTHHLTARQAGWVARQAAVKRLEVFHFSPRYERQPDALHREAMEAFQGRDEVLTPRSS